MQEVEPRTARQPVDRYQSTPAIPVPDSPPAPAPVVPAAAPAMAIPGTRAGNGNPAPGAGDGDPAGSGFTSIPVVPHCTVYDDSLLRSKRRRQSVSHPPHPIKHPRDQPEWSDPWTPPPPGDHRTKDRTNCWRDRDRSSQHSFHSGTDGPPTNQRDRVSSKSRVTEITPVNP